MSCSRESVKRREADKTLRPNRIRTKNFYRLTDILQVEEEARFNRRYQRTKPNLSQRDA
jgi:hypothetical protein